MNITDKSSEKEIAVMFAKAEFAKNCTRWESMLKNGCDHETMNFHLSCSIECGHKEQVIAGIAVMNRAGIPIRPKMVVQYVTPHGQATIFESAE